MKALIDWCFFIGKNYSFLVTVEEECAALQISKGEKIKLKYVDRFNKSSQFSNIINNRKIDIELLPNPSTTLVNGYTVKLFNCSELKCEF